MKWVKSIVNTVTASIKYPHRTDRLCSGNIDVCMLTDIGCHRGSNEDSVLYIKPGKNETESKKGFLAIVADGMGGHQSGQTASRMAVEIISKYYYQSNNPPLTALHNAFATANKKIFLSAQSDKALKGMGTTCTAFVLINNHVFISHIGDSRLYHVRKNNIKQMTEDHTLVQELVNKGIISSKEAKKHPNKNIVSRAMGTRPEADFFLKGPFRTQVNDQFVICSDGLYDLVKDNELKETVLSLNPHQACKQLINFSKKRGGYDNISVGVIAITMDRQNKNKIPDTRF